MNTHFFRFGLINLVAALSLLACAPHHTQLNNNQATQPQTQQTGSITAPTSLTGSALAFAITGTKLPSATGMPIPTDGQFSFYFVADKLFIDARNYNGFSWSTGYQYRTDANHGYITQKISWQENNASIDLTVKVHLNYATADSGTFEAELDQSLGAVSKLHFSHTGNFQAEKKPLELMAKGLPNSSLNLNFHTITANTKGLDLKQGSQIGMFFSGPNYGKFTFNGKDYETKDVQLVAVDTLTKRVQGTLTDGAPFSIQLQLDRVDMGKFVLNVDNGALQADGSFMISRWIPVPDLKIEGRFTDGLKYASKQTKIEYPYSVYLPPHYDSSGKQYPVLYLTDGQWVKEYHKIVEAHHKEFIVVAIEQGPENRRMEDYKLPGASAYVRFLKEELIPSIEKGYRTNGSRSYLGVSLGGTLGEILLSQETAAKPYFSNYVLSDGAYWANPPEIKNQLKASLAGAKTTPIKVFTAGTRQGNYLFNMDFVTRLQGLNNPSLVLRAIELKETHAEMGTPTFEAYIDQLH